MKYTAPVDPFLKFRSDLARELTAKRFPVWSYHKQDKKVYRSPASVLYARNVYDFIVLKALSSDLLVAEVGNGGGLACMIESEGQGEEYFQNTNSSDPSEGYVTTDNFFYQGPTWRVKGCADFKAENFKKEGLARNQIADAIIECLKLACPNRDFDNEWAELTTEINTKIKDKEEYIKDCTAMLETGDNAQNYEWLRSRCQKSVKSAVKFVKDLSEALQEPVLCPEYLNSDSGTTIDRKSRTWFGGTWMSTYNGKTCYWLTQAWTKADAIRKMKQSYACARRDSLGRTKKPEYLKSSIECTETSMKADRVKIWRDRYLAWIE